MHNRPLRTFHAVLPERSPDRHLTQAGRPIPPKLAATGPKYAQIPALTMKIQTDSVRFLTQASV